VKSVTIAATNTNEAMPTDACRFFYDRTAARRNPLAFIEPSG
jgi:hypothetical protein